MFDDQRLRELEAAQDLLAVQSEAQRRLIRLEWDSLREESPWIGMLRRAAGGRTAVSSAQTAGRSPWVVASAALAGLVAVRKWRTVIRWLPTAISLWRWSRRLFPR